MALVTLSERNAVLRWLARRDVVPGEAALIGPCQDGVASEFGAVVTDIDLTRSSDGRHQGSSPSPAIRDGIWRCAMPMGPHRLRRYHRPIGQIHQPE